MGVVVFCERKLRDVQPWECDKWDCPQWVGNGGYCIVNKTPLIPKIVHAQTALPEDVLKELKRKAGIFDTRAVLREVVYHYLHCPYVYGECKDGIKLKKKSRKARKKRKNKR